MLHVYTYSTSPEKVKFLMDSAQLHNLPIENIATTTAWKDLTDKLIAMQKKLDTLPDTDIVCFVDAYDVLVNASADKILETFKKFNTDLVFGAETNLWPPELHPLKPTYPESNTPFRFLNSGCYIGYVHAIKRILTWGNYQGLNDQDYCNRYFLEYYPTQKIMLDTKTDFVINMATIPWHTLVVENGLIQFGPLNSFPCFIHFNGMSYMDNDKDFVNLGDNKRGFDYNKTYSRTFLALISAKFVSERSPLRLQLTSNGHTYNPHGPAT